MNMFKNLVRNKVISAVISIIIGLFLIIRRSSALDGLIWYVGILLLVGAVTYVLFYFTSKEKKKDTLFYAAILAIAAIVFLAKPQAIVNIFPICMGILLVLSGLESLYRVFSYKGDSAKKFGVIPSVLVIITGVVIFLHPGAIADLITLFVGIALLLNGISDLMVAKSFS